MIDIYYGIVDLLKRHGISAAVENDLMPLVTLPNDLVLMIRNDKMVIYEEFWPIDSNIPELSVELTSWPLADPNCFNSLVKFVGKGLGRL